MTQSQPSGASVNPGPRSIPARADTIPSAPRISRIERLWSDIERNPGATLSALIVFYLLIACAQAATKLLWCDELITLAIAHRGSFAAIWQALVVGADPNPPLAHWMVLQSTRIFGGSALAVRLPAVLCVLLAVLSLWAILRRWVGPALAAFGVLAFMATRGFDYAYDARSYALLLGFAMASLALWLVACDFPESGRSWPPQNFTRLAALLGMAASLALGLSSNYFGVLAFFPIALGEAVRTVRLRRLEPGTWLAMAAAALPLLAFRPLIRHNLAEFDPHAWNRPQPGMIVSSYLELVEGVFWPVLGLALFALWQRRRKSHRVAPPEHTRSLQPHETAALAVLLLYPILGYLIALGGHGLISPRCVVPVCCGFGIAAALLAYRIFGSRTGPTLALLAAALLWVVARESACAFVLARQRTAFLALRNRVALQPAADPILVADSLFVLPLAHYSSASVRDRIVFPIDFDAIHALEHDDSGEQNLWAGRNGLFPIRLVAYGSYAPALLSQPDLIVVARPGGWLARQLARDGFHPVEPPSEIPSDPAWDSLGGVFTPMAHPETRLLAARRF